MTRASVSIGVAGTLGPTAIARVAAAAEAAGFHALWVNDTPGGDALAALRAVAAATTRIGLATGVVPLDRHGVDDIARAASGIPRLTLGIGTGQATGPVLARVGEAVAALRERVDARIVVGALGPRLRALGADRADGILLNWLTPDAAAAQSAQAHARAPETHVALYVRTAFDDAAAGRLRGEAARYGAFPAYAANFARLGIAASDTVVTRSSASARIPAFRAAVDELVLRAVTVAGDLDDHLRFVRDAGAAGAPTR